MCWTSFLRPRREARSVHRSAPREEITFFRSPLARWAAALVREIVSERRGRRTRVCTTWKCQKYTSSSLRFTKNSRRRRRRLNAIRNENITSRYSYTRCVARDVYCSA